MRVSGLVLIGGFYLLGPLAGQFIVQLHKFIVVRFCTLFIGSCHTSPDVYVLSTPNCAATHRL